VCETRGVGVEDVLAPVSSVYFPSVKLTGYERTRQSTAIKGTIVGIDEEKKCGFIKAKLPKKYKKADVYFPFNNVRNIGDDTVALSRNCDVRIFLNEKDPQNPRAQFVFVSGGGNVGLAAYSTRPEVRIVRYFKRVIDISSI
jgi:hypothetical protein